jgi:hypothetical protein
MQFAIFGITSSGLNLVVNLIILFLVATWLALIWWTYADARRRMDDSVLITCATLASVIPYLGTVVYTILRPPEYLDDAYERRVEIRAAEMRVRQLAEQACPHCEYPVEKTYLRCPRCRRRIKDPCVSCGKPLDPRWGVCPYCETEVVRRQPAPQARRAAAPAKGKRGAPRPAAKRAAQPQPRPAAQRPAQQRPRPQAQAAPQAPPPQPGGSPASPTQ